MPSTRKEEGISDIQCAHCNLDTVGNHEWDCPLHPHNQPIITFTGGSTQYVYIECPDCQSKDKELQLLRSRLAEAEKVIDVVIGDRTAMFLNIPCAYQYQEVLKTYRAKYPKEEGNETSCLNYPHGPSRV